MWIFGYGSLTWDNWEHEFGCLRKEEAKLLSFRRDFNKASTSRWGTRPDPCPTLGLESAVGASCVGMAFEFPDHRSEEILSYLKRREGHDFTLAEGIVHRRTGSRVRAHIPSNDRHGETYLGNRTIAERVSMARVAVGSAGRCIDYVANIRQELRSRGIDDACVEQFWRSVTL
ncbi:MAG: gamma-glutamylcyclotransferase [Pseudomonadota bacterium]|nr:gamma-glutamylcyclotransferase [Pseudomonadota bacterium]